MLEEPTPIELKSGIGPERGVQLQRSLYCVFYDACLDEADRRGWANWTCARCSVVALRSPPARA